VIAVAAEVEPRSAKLAPRSPRRRSMLAPIASSIAQVGKLALAIAAVPEAGDLAPALGATPEIGELAAVSWARTTVSTGAFRELVPTSHFGPYFSVAP
jgi:hypothetical protein